MGHQLHSPPGGSRGVNMEVWTPLAKLFCVNIYIDSSKVTIGGVTVVLPDPQNPLLYAISGEACVPH